MIYYTLHTYTKAHAGGKAASLFTLQENGLPVPPFVVIPYTEMFRANEHLNAYSDVEAIKNHIHNLPHTAFAIEKILDELKGYTWFAVRSSAIDEDGQEHSFAGQYNSYLYVSEKDLAEKIKAVWLSAFSDHVLTYRHQNKLSLYQPISVIVQAMVPAESAGVGFSINPVNGNRNQMLINAVFGLGEGLVSGQLNADAYTVEGNTLHSTIVHKTHCMQMGQQGGVVMCENPTEKKNIPVLTTPQLHAVANCIRTCTAIYGKPQDVEFAFYESNLYILQARPITTLHKVPDTSAKRIVWDNSNIIESYPGVTTPLTFSFILHSYENAYRLFLGYLGATQNEIDKNKHVFANTLGLLNGRVYYNLRTWYQMLAMVPGYSINAGFMEKMMGVKETFALEGTVKLSKSRAWLRTGKMLIKLYGRYRAIPRKRKEFKLLLDKTIAEYKQIDFSKKNAHELMRLYVTFEQTLLNEWKAPLLNDFFAMIAFGKLQKICVSYGLTQNNPNIHNDLLCGSSDIISVQPIHRSIALSTKILENETLKTFFTTNDNTSVWEQLKCGKHPDLYEMIVRYIEDFGERCVGELKLETISYTQDPRLFIQVVRNYVDAGITTHKTTKRTEEELRNAAEQEVNKILRNKWFKKYTFGKTVNKARELVSNRENLRYERTRAFGIVRELFSHIGKNFYAEGILENAADIFYLSKEEIFSFISGTAISARVKETVALRKREFEHYKTLPIPAERIETFGVVYHGNNFFTPRENNNQNEDLKGIGCCPGIVRAKVRVVMDPKELSNLNGEILVTSSTDPGWVTLFPTAGALLVERGSLLSHSAIVAREMGIPCIVGITGLLHTLKTGDTVEMNGSTGRITILK